MRILAMASREAAARILEWCQCFHQTARMRCQLRYRMGARVFPHRSSACHTGSPRRAMAFKVQYKIHDLLASRLAMKEGSLPSICRQKLACLTRRRMGKPLAPRAGARPEASSCPKSRGRHFAAVSSSSSDEGVTSSSSIGCSSDTHTGRPGGGFCAVDEDILPDDLDRGRRTLRRGRETTKGIQVTSCQALFFLTCFGRSRPLASLGPGT